MACKLAYKPHGYCGICPYFKNIIYYEKEEDFQKDDDESLQEDLFCNFFLWPIKLSNEEYENIPDWCPLDDYKG